MLVYSLITFSTFDVWAQDKSLNRLDPSKKQVVKKSQTPKRAVFKKRRPVEPFSWQKFFNPAGSLRLGYYQFDKDGPNYHVGSVWGTFETKKVFEVGLYFDGYLQSSGVNNSKGFHGEIRELYTSGDFYDWQMKLGRQIIVWGRADKINPTDNLSFRDYTLMTSAEENQRTGLFSVQETYSFGNYRVIGIWQPEWRKQKFLPVTLPAGATLEQTVPTGVDKQFALKFDHTGGDFDYSFSYFNGIDKNPDLELAPGGGFNLQLKFNPIQVVGFDTAFNAGDFGLRSEIAYTLTEDKEGNRSSVKNPFLFAVVGVDRSLNENLNVNFQVLYRQHDNWTDLSTISNPLLRAIAAQAYSLTNQMQKTKNGIAVRVAYTALDQALETELTYLTWLEQNDSISRLKINYTFNDSLKGNLGGEIYSGPDDSFLGRQKPNTRYFAELKLSF